MSRLSNARTELENYEKTRPADYVSQYQPKIKDVMGQLDGMKEFDYDPDADTAYQQYKSQYTRSAKLANQNAQANAAAQTGGYSSSYGTQAGQNAYTTTMNNLDNVLNSLQDQSRSEYTARRTGLETRLNGLQNAEKQDYQNYQNDYSNWLNGLQYRQNQYNSASSEHQQRTSNVLNGILSAVGLAAQILPWFFV